MAILKHSSSQNARFSDVVDYLTKQHDEETGRAILDEKGQMVERDEYLIEGINCTPETFAGLCLKDSIRFNANRSPEDVKTHQYIISFNPGDKAKGLTLEAAMKEGLRFARKNFPGHRVIVAAHPDGLNGSGNIHVHIVISALRFEDRVPDPEFMRLKKDGTVKESEYKAGCKHQDTAVLKYYLRSQINEFCRANGYLEIPSKAGRKVNDREYKAGKAGQQKLDQDNATRKKRGEPITITAFETRKDQLRKAIMDAASASNTWDDFANRLRNHYTRAVEINPGRTRIPYLKQKEMWEKLKSYSAKRQEGGSQKDYPGGEYYLLTNEFREMKEAFWLARSEKELQYAVELKEAKGQREELKWVQNNVLHWLAQSGTLLGLAALLIEILRDAIREAKIEAIEAEIRSLQFKQSILAAKTSNFVEFTEEFDSAIRQGSVPHSGFFDEVAKIVNEVEKEIVTMKDVLRVENRRRNDCVKEVDSILLKMERDQRTRQKRFDKILRTYEKGTRIALKNDLEMEANICLNALKELQRMREGYWVDDHIDGAPLRLYGGKLQYKVTWKSLSNVDLKKATNVLRKIEDEIQMQQQTRQTHETREERFPIDVKITRGTISYKHPDSDKWIRGKSLGSDYEMESINALLDIKEKRMQKENEKGTTVR